MRDEENTRFSLGKQIVNDAISTNMLLYPVLIWVVIAFGTLTGWVPGRFRVIEFNDDFQRLSIMIALLLTAIFTSIFISRIIWFLSLCLRGEMVSGTIIELENTGGSGTGKIHYKYLYEGTEYRKAAPILFNFSTKDMGQLRVNKPVSILVDPRNPKRSCLRDQIVRKNLRDSKT